MNAEDAHNLIHATMRNLSFAWPLLAPNFTYKGDDLVSDLFGKRLANPVGLAAGFDKNGSLVDLLGYLGFGFAEVGSVTAQAKEGNPKPRLFRLEQDNAVINRMGLNGEGAEAVAEKLKSKHFSLPIGLNIAKTNDESIVGDAAIEDILHSFKRIKDLPISYVAINGSCPNTKEGITTEAAHMQKIFTEINKLNNANLPILTKLSPDSSAELVAEMVGAASACGLSGFICGNTSTSRENLSTEATRLQAIGNGGLSGAPLRAKALQLCRAVQRTKHREQIIIGCGGVASGQDAYALISAGASFVQIYTGLVYQGPDLPLRICTELAQILKNKGQTLSEAIGCGHS